jgi:hypothetical protein
MASAQGAVGEVDTAEGSGRWEADGSFANHPSPCRWTETESWVTGRKTERLGDCFGDRWKQGSSID